MPSVPSTTRDTNQRTDSAYLDSAIESPHHVDGAMLHELQNSQRMSEEGTNRAKRQVRRMVELGRQADATPTRHVIRSILRETSSRLMDRLETGVGLPGQHAVGDSHLVTVVDVLGADAVIFTALRTVFNLVPMLSGAQARQVEHDCCSRRPSCRRRVPLEALVC